MLIPAFLFTLFFSRFSFHTVLLTLYFSRLLPALFTRALLRAFYSSFAESFIFSFSLFFFLLKSFFYLPKPLQSCLNTSQDTPETSQTCSQHFSPSLKNNIHRCLPREVAGLLLQCLKNSEKHINTCNSVINYKKRCLYRNHSKITKTEQL